jgi:uncharacterized membrane protein YgcG
MFDKCLYCGEWFWFRASMNRHALKMHPKPVSLGTGALLKAYAKKLKAAEVAVREKTSEYELRLKRNPPPPPPRPRHSVIDELFPSAIIPESTTTVSIPPSWSGDGGSFSGGGASDSWDSSPSDSSSSDSGSSSSGTD